MAAILSPLGLYGGNRKTKLPLVDNEGYKPLKGEFGSLCLRTIGRAQRPQTCLVLMQALRS
jgi:hypothetical protein